MFILTCVFLSDWLFGPKMVGDSEKGSAGTDEEWHHLTHKDELKMKAEKDGVLPGSHRPHSSLKSAFASSHPGGKRTSAHSVTFTCPQSPQVTSL